MNLHLVPGNQGFGVLEGAWSCLRKIIKEGILSFERFPYLSY
jgi:hypothetical protein